MNLPEKTPAKLILSGEHAVLYGCKAIACAVNRYAVTKVSDNANRQYQLHCPALDLNADISFDELNTLQQRLEQRYHNFTQGKISAKAILDHPAQLSLYTLSLCLQQLGIKPATGLTISIDVDIPIGAGMGSSAAMIISLMRALCQHYQRSLSEAVFLDIATTAENLQHGYSSGLDISTCYFGGMSQFQQGASTSLEPIKLPFYAIDTGRPTSSTGECAEQVKQRFGNSNIWSQFNATTEAFSEALYQNNQAALANALNTNHQLLCEIGVVPIKVQQFVNHLNQHTIAAKVCGAGSVQGDNAGMLICTQHDAAIMLCEEYGYALLPLELVYYD